MNRYEIRCTTDQTYKAIKLGAPCCNPDDYEPEICPTAEQLIGWIEEQGVIVDVFPLEDTDCKMLAYRIRVKRNKFESNTESYNSRKEATLAAIDAALEYLTNKK